MRVISSGVADAPIFIEIEDLTIVEPSDAGEGLANAGALVNRLDGISDTVITVCKTVFDRTFTALADQRPDEFQLEFGVTLGGEVGLPVVARGSAECAFKVTATWKAET